MLLLGDGDSTLRPASCAAAINCDASPPTAGAFRFGCWLVRKHAEFAASRSGLEFCHSRAVSIRAPGEVSLATALVKQFPRSTQKLGGPSRLNFRERLWRRRRGAWDEATVVVVQPFFVAHDGRRQTAHSRLLCGKTQSSRTQLVALSTTSKKCIYFIFSYNSSTGREWDCGVSSRALRSASANGVITHRRFPWRAARVRCCCCCLWRAHRHCRGRRQSP